jgi:hypothetical protein
MDTDFRDVGSIYRVLLFCTARKEIKEFFNATIPVRIVSFLCVLVLVLTKTAYPMLIMFGIIDLAGAIWTTWALKKS